MKNEIDVSDSGLTPEEIRQAIFKARQEKGGATLKEKQESLNEVNKEIHNLIFGFYSTRIREACKYPECDKECYFNDRKELCPTFSNGGHIRYEIIPD